ncbi:MAG: hypothetical protein WDM92_16135 [Caulobacteraceae bacterium]
MLNKLLDEYLTYRRTVLLGGAEPYLDDQVKQFQQRLADTDAAYQAFLAENNIDDFDAEKASLNSLQASMTDESYRVQARLKEIAGRLGEIGKQVGGISPEISLYHDTNPAASRQAAAAPDPAPGPCCRATSPTPSRCATSTSRSSSCRPCRARRAGLRRQADRINPVYQTVQSEQLQLTAEAASLRERQAALTGLLQPDLRAPPEAQRAGAPLPGVPARPGPVADQPQKPGADAPGEPVVPGRPAQQQRRQHRRAAHPAGPWQEPAQARAGPGGDGRRLHGPVRGPGAGVPAARLRHPRQRLAHPRSAGFGDSRGQGEIRLCLEGLLPTAGLV